MKNTSNENPESKDGQRSTFVDHYPTSGDERIRASIAAHGSGVSDENIVVSRLNPLGVELVLEEQNRNFSRGDLVTYS